MRGWRGEGVAVADAGAWWRGTMQADLKDQVAFVTGASRGVGRHIALELGRSGCRLFLVGRDAAALERVRAEIVQRFGVPCLFEACDVVDDDAMQAALRRCAEELGGINILICGAGQNRRREITRVDVAVWDQVMKINLLHGVMHLTRFAVPYMIQNKARNQSSTVVYLGTFAIRDAVNPAYVGIEPYLASKAGVNAFASVMSNTLRPYDIKVSVLNFGLAATELGLRSGPLGTGDPNTLIQPEDVAAAVLYICRTAPTVAPLEITLIPNRPVVWQQQQRDAKL
ncbi:putative oxidoreductase YoxD [Porphyridium purpureum]|uniref:Putative oxidoreductase YoxD n=1 Tax=Porphyridium purpureum TaxID=35688 RepID=A0A5J4YYV6_PORPP|nr:putative oxidoreductase YoxD [Porphyridium purpureum]|eukprot:POR3493..scf208_2